MMYNFDDEMKCSVNPTPCEPAKETFSILLNDACCKAADALMMARAINMHMFATGDDTEGKQAEPRCLREVLTNHDYCLNALCKELKRIMDQLGV